jgi:hypothetical protein
VSTGLVIPVCAGYNTPSSVHTPDAAALVNLEVVENIEVNAPPELVAFLISNSVVPEVPATMLNVSTLIISALKVK